MIYFIYFQLVILLSACRHLAFFCLYFHFHSSLFHTYDNIFYFSSFTIMIVLYLFYFSLAFYFFILYGTPELF